MEILLENYVGNCRNSSASFIMLFALSTYIYDYDLELIFNGMAVIFIAEFDEMSVDLYLHGNSKRTAYYHKLICLSYVKVNYTCV